MKKLFLGFLLLTSFASYALPLVQPFVELGMIYHQHLIGPLDVNAQANSFVKGALVALGGTFLSKKFPISDKSSEKKIFLYNLGHNATNIINLLDLIKNHHSVCILSRVLGFYVGKRIIEKYV